MPRLTKKNKQIQGQSSEPQFPISVFAELLPRDRHPNLIFEPHHFRYHENSKALQRIYEKECEYPRAIDWAPLNEVGLTRQITRALTQSIRYENEVYDVQDFLKLIQIQEPIYQELTLEFLATVQLYMMDSVDSDFLSFKLGGNPHSLSLRQMAVYLQIYTEDELNADWFPRYIMTGTRLEEGEVSAEDWSRFSDKAYLTGKNNASALKDPKDKILQKLLAHTITLRRQNTDKVTKADLWYLLKIKDRERINLPYCVGKFLHAYACGTKKESRLCGGHFITRIAKGLGVSLRPRAHPYTLVPNPGHILGIDMFRPTGVVRMQKGKYLPVISTGSSSRTAVPRAGSRGKRPASQQESDEEEDDEEEEDEEEEAEEEAEDTQTAQEPPFWQGFMTSFDNMRIEQEKRWKIEEDFRNESRYEWGVNRYQNDWLIHDHERMGHHVPDHIPAPYHHPPQWGEPGGILPAPVYDRDAALIEIQRQHQQHMHASEYHQQQQTWGTSWSTPPPSNWQQGALQDWLFGSSQPPPQDPNQDPSFDGN